MSPEVLDFLSLHAEMDWQSTQDTSECQLPSFSCDNVTDVPVAECEALLRLYNTTNGASWTNNTNWLSSTTVGDWNGITVDN